MTIQDYPKYKLYGIFLMVMPYNFPRLSHIYFLGTFLMVAHKQPPEMILCLAEQCYT